MADREFIKHAPITLADPMGQRPPNSYTLAMFLGEFVWSFAKWSEDDWEEAQIRIGDAVDAAADGEPVRLSLEDFEKLREATKAAQITGHFAPKLRRFSRSIRSATSVKSVTEVVANGTVPAS